MQVLGTIRELNTANFSVIVDAVEDFDVDLSFDETGEVLAGLESGKYVSFCARVRVLHRELGELATDCLGGCIYEDFAGFQDHKGIRRYKREVAYPAYVRRCIAEGRHPTAGSDFMIGSYFSDMVHEACTEARATIESLREQTAAVYIRGVRQ